MLAHPRRKPERELRDVAVGRRTFAEERAGDRVEPFVAERARGHGKIGAQDLEEARAVRVGVDRDPAGGIETVVRDEGGPSLRQRIGTRACRLLPEEGLQVR